MLVLLVINSGAPHFGYPNFLLDHTPQQRSRDSNFAAHPIQLSDDFSETVAPSVTAARLDPAFRFRLDKAAKHLPVSAIRS
ncbi:hypothetical protein D7D52_03970 [Nocardia yunnanensis]|uniref:Uncharacterized protein n=1 Tax=Nocardia yunnanensis TaxID=2382165 RepID=A0A386Z6D2_9NOCA|nr:hypothetical protein D7D52_03970 [Nocardia yunnanensis]